MSKDLFLQKFWQDYRVAVLPELVRGVVRLRNWSRTTHSPRVWCRQTLLGPSRMEERLLQRCPRSLVGDASHLCGTLVPQEPSCIVVVWHRQDSESIQRARLPPSNPKMGREDLLVVETHHPRPKRKPPPVVGMPQTLLLGGPKPWPALVPLVNDSSHVSSNCLGRCISSGSQARRICMVSDPGGFARASLGRCCC